MEFVTTTDIRATPERVFSVWSDVERWPPWTASVTRVEALDGALVPGARFRIVQPRLPALVWEVTALDPGRSWTWVTRGIGAVTTGHHVVRSAPGGAVAEARLVQEGWLNVPLAWLMQGLTRRYMALEAAGLARTSEAPT